MSHREIIDESDVFIDVHKAIRRMQPSPRTRLPKHALPPPALPSNTPNRQNADSASDGEAASGLPKIVERSPDIASAEQQDEQEHERREQAKRGRTSSLNIATSPRHKQTTFLVRRRSSNIADGEQTREMVQHRTNSPELREYLKHLGPSNLASRPRTTRFQSVKIKPGTGDPRLKGTVAGGVGQGQTVSNSAANRNARERERTVSEGQHESSVVMSPVTTHGGVGEGLLSNAGIDATDGVQALHTGYGTMSGSTALGTSSRPGSSWSKSRRDEVEQSPFDTRARVQFDHDDESREPISPRQARRSDTMPEVETESSAVLRGEGTSREGDDGDADSFISISTVRSLPEPGEQVAFKSGRARTSRGTTRSGSITENIVEFNGIRKVVLDVSSSSEEGLKDGGGAGAGADRAKENEARDKGAAARDEAEANKKKKRRRKRAKGGKKDDAGGPSENGSGRNPDGDPEQEGDEDTPLLVRDR